MKPSPTSSTPAAAHVTDKLNELANRQADLVDSFPRFYRLVPPAIKRRVAGQFDEFIVQLDSLVAKLESTVQKRRVHNRKSMSLLQGAIHQADSNLAAASEEMSSIPELEGLTAEFARMREHYEDTLEVLDSWMRELDGNRDHVSLAA